MTDEQFTDHDASDPAGDFDDFPATGSNEQRQDPADAPADQAAQDELDDFEDQVDLSPETVAEMNAAMAPAAAEGVAAGQIPERWEIDDYLATGNDAKGAAKLADSAVAPLVAMARGYETIHEEGLAAAYAKYPLPRKSTTQGKRLVSSVSRGDLLIMPWFTHDDIEHAVRRNAQPKPVTIQYRPARPEVNEKGKEIKYEFVGGQKTPLGMHPAFPTSWIDDTPVVLLAEGLLKGDSALSAYLLANGSTREDLAWTEADSTGKHADDVVAARAKLARLINRIPVDQQILILTIGGVDNWKNNSEWRSIEMKGRAAWVGIDGDVSENPNVYRAASELWEYLKEKKKAVPFLLAPVDRGADSHDLKKVGIDDYLSKIGTWNRLIEQVSTSLPPKPSGTNVEFIGQYRISDDGASLEICEPVPDPINPDAPPSRGVWKEVLPIGGRIASTVTNRAPTPEETATGSFGLGVDEDAYTHDVEVLVQWKDPNVEGIKEASVFGPEEILNYMPDQWARHGARIPSELLRSPCWPPRNKEADEWLRAVKANKANETSVRVKWEVMGWVPVRGSLPAFIVGNQTIDSGITPDPDTFSGVGEMELSGAFRFGVGDDDPRPLDDEEYRDQIRGDIERTIRAFVLRGAWTDRKVASTVVAAALRPTMPKRPTTTVYCVGPRRKGKSWTASTMMGFWSKTPGDWEGALPGSAKDTAAAMELAVSRAPIWVVDDLAPASSRQQSEAEQNKIANLIRDLFNGSGKRRSDANMGSRKVHSPRALLVVTGENELQVNSAKDRCVHLNIGFGALSESTDPTKAINQLCNVDGAPARVTQALIRYLQHYARQQSGKWSSLFSQVTSDHETCVRQAAQWMEGRGEGKGDTSRHAGLAADLVLPLVWLARLAQEVGVDEEIYKLILLDMVTDVFELVTLGHKEANEGSPGRALLQALHSAMYRKRAHVLHALKPGQPPTNEYLSGMLGWEFADGSSRPRGETIGVIVEDPKYGQVIYFDQRAAFAVAQREAPSLIPPGQGFRSSWNSVVGEGLAIRDLCRPANGDERGRVLSTGRERRAELVGDVSVTGTPVSLNELLNVADDYREKTGQSLD